MDNDSIFILLPLRAGLILDLSDDVFPTLVSGWNNGALHLPEEATHYGMVTAGQAHLDSDGETYILRAGMFFVARANQCLRAYTQAALAISSPRRPWMPAR